MAEHPAYRKIVAMGQKAVPLLLAEMRERLDEKQGIEIIIDAKGQWLYKGQVLDADTMLQALQTDLSGRENRRVRIRGDKTSSLGSTVTVLDIARRAGADGVDIVTERD